MKQTILIIEDEIRIANWIKVFFEKEGFIAELAYDGRTGLNRAYELEPDLIVLDLMLPKLDGMEVCKQLRKDLTTPIIMLTAREANSDKVKGLEIGADDYVIKPFNPDEVVARAKAILRRTTNTVQQIFHSGDIVLDEGTETVTIRNKELSITHDQFLLLRVFMQHPNQVLTREQLINNAFGKHFDNFDRAIDSHVFRLRKLLENESCYPIQTVYGAGYKFSEDTQKKRSAGKT